MVSLLCPAALARDLSIRDLTDPRQGAHAIQHLVDDAVGALAARWSCAVEVVRAHPVVPVEDNYDRLGFSPGAVARDARYSRYVSETCMLRAHTSAVVPGVLRRLAAAPVPPADLLVACPGMVYRRDSIDRLHTGTPHQLDLWRITSARRMDVADLEEMIAVVVGAVLPGREWRSTPSPHPYTLAGCQVDVLDGEVWVEVGECGLAGPGVLAGAGLDPDAVSGLAMGLGLDRLLMLRKGIPDIRLLRSTDPRVAAQMDDLSPYRPVSLQPPVRRDLSVAVGAGVDVSTEALGDRVRDALGPAASSVESVEVLAVASYKDVPAAAADRLGMTPGQRNVLLRVVIRDVDRTLTSDEANELRDRIYAALHEGSRAQWATASWGQGC